MLHHVRQTAQVQIWIPLLPALDHVDAPLGAVRVHDDAARGGLDQQVAVGPNPQAGHQVGIVVLLVNHKAQSPPVFQLPTKAQIAAAVRPSVLEHRAHPVQTDQRHRIGQRQAAHRFHHISVLVQPAHVGGVAAVRLQIGAVSAAAAVHLAQQLQALPVLGKSDLQVSARRLGHQQELFLLVFHQLAAIAPPDINARGQKRQQEDAWKQNEPQRNSWSGFGCRIFHNLFPPQAACLQRKIL